MTNAAKNQPNAANITAGGSRSTVTAFAKPTAAIKVALPTRVIRTRSSTGGSGANIEDDDGSEAFHAARDDESSMQGGTEGHEDHDEDRADSDEAMDENAMVIDQPIARPIKAIRQSARSSASGSAIVKADAKVTVSAVSAVARVTRAPLASKTTNRTTSTATASTAASRLAAAKKKPQAVTDATAALRERRAAAEAELQAVYKAEEEHAAKRPKTTSEHEGLRDYDDEEGEEAASKVRRNQTAVNGRGMKDEGWVDLDEGDEDDPLMVSNYVVEVYEYMRDLEVSRVLFACVLCVHIFFSLFNSARVTNFPLIF